MRASPILLASLSFLGCGDGTSADAGPDPNADAADPICGEEVLPVDEVTGTEGIAIGPDGALYYSQPGAVGRAVAGSADDAWVDLPGAGTTWGLALDEGASTLYVASPDSGAIYAIDLGATEPSAEPLFEGADSPNGLVVGPDGAVYYSDISEGRVYRIDAASGERDEVTASTVPTANGIFFESDSSLLVLAYTTGEVWRLTLDANHVETDRVLAIALGAAVRPDGIGRDETGRWYVTDNAAGELIRVDADFSASGVLATSIPAAANLAWGKGNLFCTDIYVASSGTLGHYASDVAGSP
jgi:sugar lactone lactonase YvrE